MVQSPVMSDTELDLIEKAIVRHRTIYPCGDRRSFGDCFTRDGSKLLFWYNTEDRSTHLVSAVVTAS